MPNPIHALLALALAGACSSLAHAQDADRALLATFCDAADIQGAACAKAKGYPNAGDRVCDVKLNEDRYSGRFVAGANMLLVVNYESGCESHATDNGGAAIFEQSGGKTVFRGFAPGSQVNDCVVLKGERQDQLACLAGHMGQGILSSGVAKMVFTENAGKDIGIAVDMLVTAEDANGAYGANVVTCKESSKYFQLTDIKPGPRTQTVSVKAAYADAETIKKACAKKFPKPKETFGKLQRGDAYVPEGFEKRGTFVIDLVTRKVEKQ
jgi:hypothetical protein